MSAKQAARRCGNNMRAESRPGRTQTSIAHEYERWTKYAGWLLGVCFGLMFAIALIAG